MNKKSYGINIGFSFILVIFVILCLVSFATLSVVSANADYKLSTKLADRTTAYYTACNKAYEQLATIEANSSGSTSFSVPINEIQELQVSLEFLYPDSESSSDYVITKWHTITTNIPEMDESLNVFH